MEYYKNFIAFIAVVLIVIGQLNGQTVEPAPKPTDCDLTVGRFDTIFGVGVFYCDGSGNVTCRPACSGQNN